MLDESILNNKLSVENGGKCFKQKLCKIKDLIRWRISCYTGSDQQLCYFKWNALYIIECLDSRLKISSYEHYISKVRRFPVILTYSEKN